MGSPAALASGIGTVQNIHNAGSVRSNRSGEAVTVVVRVRAPGSCFHSADPLDLKKY